MTALWIRSMPKSELKAKQTAIEVIAGQEPIRSTTGWTLRPSPKQSSPFSWKGWHRAGTLPSQVGQQRREIYSTLQSWMNNSKGPKLGKPTKTLGTLFRSRTSTKCENWSSRDKTILDRLTMQYRPRHLRMYGSRMFIWIRLCQALHLMGLQLICLRCNSLSSQTHRVSRSSLCSAYTVIASLKHLGTMTCHNNRKLQV